MDAASPSAEDWRRLAALRRRFLEIEERPGASGDDYWRERRDLELYDAFPGERIGWKWDAVLDELRRLGWRPPAGALLDWGCGTGVAAARVLEAFAAQVELLPELWDRSPAAREYAAERLAARDGVEQAERTPRSPRVHGSPPRQPPALLLVSHVLGELDGRELDALVELALGSAAVLWVEPGSRPVARRLAAVRERLRERLHLVAPCPHAGACGTLAAGAEHEWCHHFAAPPPEAFTDGSWARFGRELGVDLRSLPYAFLALQRAEPAPPPACEGERARVLGRPRMRKGRAELHVCRASGVEELTLLQRSERALFRRLERRPTAPGCWCIACAGGRIERVEVPGAE